MGDIGYTDKELWRSRNSRWVIAERDIPARGRTWVVVLDNTSGWCDWPIRYSDGRIAYDNPHRIPKYVQDKVARIMTRRKYDAIQKIHNDVESEQWDEVPDKVRSIKSLLLAFENKWIEREREFRPLEI